MAEPLVLDASAMVHVLVGSPVAAQIAQRLRGNDLHVPAHFDAEVLSALGRLNRAGHLTVRQVATRLTQLIASPIERHLLGPLVIGAWGRRQHLRLVDALYVELANQLNGAIITTDSGLAAALRSAELFSASD
ncbi:MAG: type II toxin-antitoxin system VapC family toxin [Acidimicrobiia bacterium]